LTTRQFYYLIGSPLPPPQLPHGNAQPTRCLKILTKASPVSAESNFLIWNIGRMEACPFNLKILFESNEHGLM
jgi:hypothetical protein